VRAKRRGRAQLGLDGGGGGGVRVGDDEAEGMTSGALGLATARAGGLVERLAGPDGP
jgi:hypothetical protein